MRFRRNEHETIERALRNQRAEASDELVRSIAGRVRPRERFHVAPRLLLAGALTVAMLAAVASVGGTTAAVRPAVNVGDLIKQVVTPAGKNNGNGNAVLANSSSQQSSAEHQYKFIICHHPPGNPSNEQTLEVGSQAAVDAHLSNHPGDHVGPCVGDAPRR